MGLLYTRSRLRRLHCAPLRPVHEARNARPNKDVTRVLKTQIRMSQGCHKCRRLRQSEANTPGRLTAGHMHRQTSQHALGRSGSTSQAEYAGSIPVIGSTFTGQMPSTPACRGRQRESRSAVLQLSYSCPSSDSPHEDDVGHRIAFAAGAGGDYWPWISFPHHTFHSPTGFAPLTREFLSARCS
jgi:hypothetical protein